MSIKRFLFNATFLKHLVFIIIAGIVIIFGAIKALDIYTLNNEEYTLPNYKDLTIDELDEYRLGSELEFIIADSLYDDKEEPGTILAQNPPAGSKVKRGRNIYLTIVTETPEKIKMPNLHDLTLRQSISLLETYGLKVDKLVYEKNLAQNAVLQQVYKGDPIEPGEEIYKGSEIELVLGKGRRESEVTIPFLIGKKQKQAIRMLHKNSLNVGEQYFLDSEDTSRLRIYSTEPSSAKREKAKMGTYVDLYYRSDSNFNFFELIREIEKQQADTTEADSSFISDDYFNEDIILE
ncbi:MAG: PASTA domain-containing protein [Bacteroidota bacterium]